MKLFTKLSLLAAALTAIGTSAASADDQQLQNRLAREQPQISPRTTQTTVAVYANRRGVSRADASVNEQRPEARFEIRTDAHGRTSGVWTEAN